MTCQCLIANKRQTRSFSPCTRTPLFHQTVWDCGHQNMIKAWELRGGSQVEFRGNWAVTQRLTNRKLIRNCVGEGKGRKQELDRRRKWGTMQFQQSSQSWNFWEGGVTLDNSYLSIVYLASPFKRLSPEDFGLTALEEAEWMTIYYWGRPGGSLQHPTQREIQI